MSTETRVTTLEQAMAELAVAQARTQHNLDQLSLEMREFKQAMAAASQDLGERLTQVSHDLGERITEVSHDVGERITQVSHDLGQQIAQVSHDLGERIAQVSHDTGERITQVSHDVGQQIAQVSRQMGELSNKMGTLVEDIVAPSIPELFARCFGVADPDSWVRPRRRDPSDPSRRQEFDLVAWGGDIFLVNETKSRLTPRAIEDLLELLARVREFFPEAQGRQVVGSLASFQVDPSLVAAAERRGLLVFGLGSGLFEVLNSPGFEPRRF